MAPKPSELAGVDSSSAHSVKAPFTCLTIRQIKIIEPTDSMLSNCSNLSKQLSTCVCKGTKLQIEKKEKRHRYKAHQVKGRKHSSTASTTDTVRELVFPIMSYALDTRHPIVREVDDRACKSPQITYIKFAIHLPFDRKAKRDMPRGKPRSSCQPPTMVSDQQPRIVIS
ncbi:unnamed protein product [Prunus armeniaca]|uniref:Uncharacterized protein n=1 Tax=Prunus armeniaca TaxID=36596 RepID=A0A6J5U068_PRUAR|nr:unnamed protein product [Prunus armeniaca]